MSDTSDILKKIIKRKLVEVEERKGLTPYADVKKYAKSAATPRSFVYALQRKIQAGQAAVIAEN